MQIHISGHHVDITDAIREQINLKLQKIANHYPSLIAMTVILGHEPNKHTVEVNTTYEGAPISAAGSEENLFAAIALTSKKIDAALAHRKGLLKARQHAKPALAIEDEPLNDIDDELEEEFDYDPKETPAN